MDMIATTFDIACSFEGWRLRSGDRTVTTKELQWSATSAERRKFERDFQAERMAGLVRGFPNIAVLPDRPPNVALQTRTSALRESIACKRRLGSREFDSADIAELHMLLRLPKIVVVLHRKPALGRAT
jgi:hypothetical protein